MNQQSRNLSWNQQDPFFRDHPTIPKKPVENGCIRQSGSIQVKMKVYPTILLKTKDSDSPVWGYPTMLLKKKD